MRYSVEPNYKRYVKGYGFLSFARKFGDKYGKNLMNTGIMSAKKLAIVNIVKNNKYNKKTRM